MTKIMRIWMGIQILFIFHFIKQAILFYKEGLVPTFGWEELFAHLLAQLILVFLSGVGFTAFIAILPITQGFYQEKFEKLLPIFTLLSLIFIIISSTFDYSEDRRHTWQMPKPKYKDDYITRDLDLDCSSIKYGTFDEGGIITERNADKQIQINKISKIKEEFRVVWKNSCEYTLVNIADSSQQRTIKIASVTPNSYSCCIISHEKPDYPTFTTIQVLNRQETK